MVDGTTAGLVVMALFGYEVIKAAGKRLASLIVKSDTVPPPAEEFRTVADCEACERHADDHKIAEQLRKDVKAMKELLLVIAVEMKVDPQRLKGLIS